MVQCGKGQKDVHRGHVNNNDNNNNNNNNNKIFHVGKFYIDSLS